MVAEKKKKNGRPPTPISRNRESPLSEEKEGQEG